MKEVDKFYALAAKRVAYAKKRDQVDAEFAQDYLLETIGELEEVVSEIKKDNTVRLEDELSDVLWCYLNMVATLRDLGYIRSGEHVVEHGIDKFTERFPAIEAGSREVWDEIKVGQKERLAKLHEEYLKGLKKRN